MGTAATYSFLDVNCSLVGPGGNLNLSSGGIAEEGITIEPVEDINAMVGGADGTPMHSLIAFKGAKGIVRVLKTSPLNAQIQTMVNLQRTSSALHGVNVLSISNPVIGDKISGQQVAFARQAPITYAKNAGMNEWHFDIGIADFTLGGGLLARLLAAAGAGSVLAGAL